jgi:predicted unusual protein kinase regulating ubiquinone biosynthesis (AarF/ABC1/UbiB family)
LAQVHRARLADGSEVVVKVQRPRIEAMTETDLAAIAVAARWLKWYGPISRRVDLDRLFAEFAATTRRELDFVAEGRHAARFAENFADDPGIYLARVYWPHTTRRVLTLENVAFIKITDLVGIEAAGISRAEVAARLYETYLEQIFIHNFVHADPHPGNLFLRALPRSATAPAGSPTPFQLIFVDFGMVAIIPERLRASLREYLIAIGTHDSHRMVQAYLDSGVLMPGADRRRLEEVHDVLFQRLEGIKIGQLSDVALAQASFLWREYRDILFELPFQFPADMVFAVRAVAILAGMATTLDREFDPWASTIPFAERLAADQLARDWRTGLEEVGELLRLAVRLPGRLDRLITQAQRGELAAQTALVPDAARAVRRLQRSVDRLAWNVAAAALLLAGVWVRTTEGAGGLSAGLLAAAAAAFVWGMLRR